MSATEPLCHLIGINFARIARAEKLILEAEIFVQLYTRLNEIFRRHYKNYFRIMNFNEERENAMLDAQFIKNIIQDLVSEREYSINGIAYHTNIPEEVIQEIVVGNNTNPSLRSSLKIIELHRASRFNLYRDIVQKILTLKSPQF